MGYPFTVTCLVCGQYAAVIDIVRIGDKPQPRPWHRVIMGCGDTITLPSASAEQIWHVAAGRLASTGFQHPDRAGDDAFVTVVQGRPVT